MVYNVEDNDNDNYSKHMAKEETMKKALIASGLIVLVGAVSIAYACGEKSQSRADVPQSKAELTTSSEAAVTPAVARSIESVSATGTGYNGCASKAGLSKTSASNRCGMSKAGVEAQQAVVKKTGAQTYNCPASPSCPTPCNREAKDAAAKSSSASINPDAESENVTATSASVVPEAGTLK